MIKMSHKRRELRQGIKMLMISMCLECSSTWLDLSWLVFSAWSITVFGSPNARRKTRMTLLRIMETKFFWSKPNPKIKYILKIRGILRLKRTKAHQTSLTYIAEQHTMRVQSSFKFNMDLIMPMIVLLTKRVTIPKAASRWWRGINKFANQAREVAQQVHLQLRLYKKEAWRSRSRAASQKSTGSRPWPTTLQTCMR